MQKIFKPDPGRISDVLGTAEASVAALEAVCKPHDGQSPDAVFTCAGSQKPMFFMDMTEER
jgi:3-dehydrosphinganine reductase